jgi:hypothetical protein
VNSPIPLKICGDHQRTKEHRVFTEFQSLTHPTCGPPGHSLPRSCKGKLSVATVAAHANTAQASGTDEGKHSGSANKPGLDGTQSYHMDVLLLYRV